MNEIDIPVPEAFIRKFPNLKQEKVKKLHNKYLNSIRKELFQILPYTESDTFHFPLKRVQDQCADFYYENVRYYIWQEFFSIQPFFYVIRPGRKWLGLTSEVKIINQKYIDLLIDTADTENLVKSFYSKFDTNERVIIPIDIDSLCAYISRTEHTLRETQLDSALYNKLLQNLRTAKFFKIISTHYFTEYGDYVIPHVVSDKVDYGRTYYKGINLQNCSKEVRIAALGDHYSYDLNAAVYAVKLILAKDIYEQFGQKFEGQFTYTKEYLDHKTQIRHELANILKQHMPNYPNPLKLVKEAMTAIGFGAKVHEGSWQSQGITQYSSLHNIIYNKSARQHFVKHDFVVNFLKEQDMLSKIIYEYYSNNVDFVEKVKNIPDMFNSNGKLIKSKVLAYLYQQMETKIMDLITSDIVPHLRIHDSFIMLKPLSNETLRDIKVTLNELSPYLTISTDVYNGWISQDVLDEEKRHQERIKQEELIANNGVLPIKYIKKYTVSYSNNDSKCYDGYDDGSRYEEYDSSVDEYLNEMTLEEKQEHYRILGIKTNNLPDHINKLIRG